MSPRAAALALAWALLALAPSYASADPEAEHGASPAVVEGPPAGDDGVVPLDAGEPAPWDGFLLSEVRLDAAAAEHSELAECTVRRDVERRVLEETSGRLARAESGVSDAVAGALERASPGFLDRNAFWIGVGVGILGAAALVYGAVEVLDARGP